MYASIEEAWNNDTTIPLFSTYNNNKECEIKEYKSPIKRIDDNILIDEPPINMMGTPVHHNKNNYNKYHQEQLIRPKSRYGHTHMDYDDRFNEIKYGSKNKIIEEFIDSDDEYYDIEESKKEMKCIDHLKHILKCKRCFKILKKKFRGKDMVTKKQYNFIDDFLTNDVKEILMVILIGIFIILILDIFIRILEKK